MTKSEEKRINMGYFMQIHEKMQVIIKNETDFKLYTSLYVLESPYSFIFL